VHHSIEHFGQGFCLSLLLFRVRAPVAECSRQSLMRPATQTPIFHILRATNIHQALVPDGEAHRKGLPNPAQHHLLCDILHFRASKNTLVQAIKCACHLAIFHSEYYPIQDCPLPREEFCL
jgi:hypothetical protein